MVFGALGALKYTCKSFSLSQAQRLLFLFAFDVAD